MLHHTGHIGYTALRPVCVPCAQRTGHIGHTWQDTLRDLIRKNGADLHTKGGISTTQQDGLAPTFLVTHRPVTAFVDATTGRLDRNATAPGSS